jgi:hypothetical protein
MLEILPLQTPIKIHSLGDKLYTLLTQSYDLKSIFLILPSFGCLDHNNKIIFFNNPAAPVILPLDLELPDAYLFFIKNYLPAKHLDLELTYQLLMLAEEIPLSQEKIQLLLLY